MRILRWTAGALILTALCAFAFLQNKTLLARRYDHWRYPSIRETSALSKDIAEDLEIRKYNEAAREYRRVQAKLDEAESLGYDVAWLKAKMPNALRLIKEKKFYFAGIHLNTIDVRIPGKREAVIPAGEYDHNEGMTPDVQGSPKRVQRRRRARKTRSTRPR